MSIDAVSSNSMTPSTTISKSAAKKERKEYKKHIASDCKTIGLATGLGYSVIKNTTKIIENNTVKDAGKIAKTLTKIQMPFSIIFWTALGAFVGKQTGRIVSLFVQQNTNNKAKTIFQDTNKEKEKLPDSQNNSEKLSTPTKEGGNKVKNAVQKIKDIDEKISQLEDINENETLNTEKTLISEEKTK